MENRLLNFLLLLILSVCGGELRAQNVKIGVVDRQYIYSTLAATANSQLEERNSEEGLLSEMETLGNKLKEKRATYEEVRKKGDMASMANLDNESKQLLGSMEAKREERSKRRAELNRSRESKIRDAIRLVAIEKGYTSVLDADVVPFFSEKDNISDLVLQKLGVAK